MDSLLCIIFQLHPYNTGLAPIISHHKPSATRPSPAILEKYHFLPNADQVIDLPVEDQTRSSTRKHIETVAAAGINVKFVILSTQRSLIRSDIIQSVAGLLRAS